MIDEKLQPIVMPHSRAAEEALLGALLVDPEYFSQLVLQPEDFYIIRNSFIFAAMQDLHRRRQSIDYVTVCTTLDAQKRLAEIGGPAAVMELINCAPPGMGAESYTEIIRERAKRRAIIRATQKLTQSAFDMNSDLGSAVGDALDSLAKSVISQKGAVHISQFISTVFDEVDQAQKSPRETFGIPTGFEDIDRITYGLQKGEKIVLSGEPGVGKSVLAAQILINAARAGHAGALYEMEMSGRQVVRRSIAAETKRISPAGNITTQKMRQGKLTDAEIPVFTAAIEAMSGMPIYITEASDLTTAEIRADLMRLKEYFRVELVVIDYEGLLGDNPDQRDENVRSKMVSKRVHDIAKDLDMAVIAIGDMTKEGIKGQVKGQGAIAGTARGLHDADQIIIIKKTEQENVVRLTWEKMREGDSDRFVDLVHVPGFPMFGSIKPARR